MKGDFFLLGITGAAILAIPLAVSAGGLGGVPLATPPPASASAVAAAPPAASWQSTPILGGTVGAMEGASPAPKDTPPAPKEKSDPAEKEYKPAVESFRALNRSTGRVEEVSLRDYVRGAIAAEMPASFHLEALKAQGVAALTYAYYHHQEQQKNPDPLLLGADFSADPDKREGYMTEKNAKKFYGDNWRYNWAKVCEAADEAQQWVVLAEGSPIAAAYHAISAGNTEDAANIWGGPLPCLTPVDSSWDILAKGYKSTETFSQSKIKALLAGAGLTLPPNPDDWFVVEEVSESGYVTRVRVGTVTVSGNQLRNLLGLRSSSFRVERQGKDFLFLVEGYGHGAGLSQNGADYLARQGSDFREILEHYYPGGRVIHLE